MRDYSTARLDALARGDLITRDIIQVRARNRNNGNTEVLTFVSDDHDNTLLVYDPDDGSTKSVSCIGAGGLAEYGAIPATADLSVEELSIQLDHNSPAVNLLLRTYDVKFCPIIVWNALFTMAERNLIEPAEVDFVGWIDSVDIRTPAENEEGAAVLACVSDAQEMSRSNPAKRSDADQKLRDPDDDFFQYANVVGNWEQFWGKEGGKIHGIDKNFEAQNVSRAFRL